ncbi:unnamed protein product [Protopolystoma xenopodis]|uniref:Uncharacterized protein n=1 Tax=Protopolystoma xenopodis TaxID=117903 RepID=A0A3S5A494_9PLAT|nr:unnamed protein product [Protopolystoma xenopodis]
MVQSVQIVQVVQTLYTLQTLKMVRMVQTIKNLQTLQTLQKVLMVQLVQTKDITEASVGTDCTDDTEYSDPTVSTEGIDGTVGTDGRDGTEGTDGTVGTDGTDALDPLDTTDPTDGTDGTDDTESADLQTLQKGSMVQLVQRKDATVALGRADLQNGTDGTDGTSRVGGTGERVCRRVVLAPRCHGPRVPDQPSPDGRREENVSVGQMQPSSCRTTVATGRSGERRQCNNHSIDELVQKRRRQQKANRRLHSRQRGSKCDSWEWECNGPIRDARLVPPISASETDRPIECLKGETSCWQLEFGAVFESVRLADLSAGQSRSQPRFCWP